MRHREFFRSLLGAALIAFSAVSPARLAEAAEATVTISQGVDVDTLDPVAKTVTPSNNVQNAMFDTLLRHDTSGRLIPWQRAGGERRPPGTQRDVSAGHCRAEPTAQRVAIRAASSTWCAPGCSPK
jgi:ABC-type oligopeptide transport system substrate-binding subunit